MLSMGKSTISMAIFNSYDEKFYQPSWRMALFGPGLSNHGIHHGDSKFPGLEAQISADFIGFFIGKLGIHGDLMGLNGISW